MLKPKINDALNEQIKNELSSSYNYLAVAAYFESEELPGFAHFFRLQAQEELTHAMKFFDYVAKVGCPIKLEGIPAPKQMFKNCEEAFEHGLNNEKMVTKQINQIMDMSIKESDHATKVLLHWFVTEQLEEETLMSHCLKRVMLVKGDGKGILILDQEFAKRAAAGGE